MEAGSAIVIPLRSKRRKRAQLVQKFQHVLPAMLLLGSAAAALRGDERGAARVIAVVEAVAAVAFILSIAHTVRQARTSDSGHAHGVDWPDVFVAGVFFAEALERWHRRGKIFQPALLSGVAMLVLGVFHGRILGAAERHRSLKIDEHGMSIGKRPFGKFVEKWDAIESITIDGRYARIARSDGTARRIDLDDVQDSAPVRRALEDARSRLLQP